jgi:hypothetical protein
LLRYLWLVVVAVVAEAVAMYSVRNNVAVRAVACVAVAAVADNAVVV